MVTYQKADNQKYLAPVIISYRDDRGKRMHGAFYDHYLVRNITQHPTKITIHKSLKITHLEEFIHNTTLVLGIGDQLGKGQIPDIIADSTQERGLLIIPGRSHKDADKEREGHEKELLANAIRRGQPVLAICGGARRLWGMFGGRSNAVKDHLYSSMPYILASGAVANNKQIHRIHIIPNSILSAGMYGKMPEIKTLMVNSIHWEAPDADPVYLTVSDRENDKTQTMLEISARSVLTEDIAVKNRKGNELQPQSNTVEGFETRYGAPLIGVQWHPEAYYLDDYSEGATYHLSLLQYMAKAGNTYQTRCYLVDEFKTMCGSPTLWDKHGFFKPKDLLTPSKTDVSELSIFTKLKI